MWRIGELFSGNLGARPPGRHRSARSDDRKVPAELPPAVDRRLLELDAWPTRRAVTMTRRFPPLPNLPGATGFTVGRKLPATVLRGADVDERQRGRPRHVLLDPRHPSHDRRQSEGRDRAVAARHALRPVDRRAREPSRIRTASTTSRAAPRTGCRATGAGGPEAIDDLWHASINTRGKFFNREQRRSSWPKASSARSPISPIRPARAPGSGLAGAQLSVTNQYAYKTSYEGACGATSRNMRSTSRPVCSPSTSNGNPLNAPVWSAATQLDAQAAVAGAVIGWDTRRRIVTMNNTTSTAVPFRLANLSAAQQASLNSGWSSLASPPTPQAVLNYLRGDKSNEGVSDDQFPHAVPYSRRHRLLGCRPGGRAECAVSRHGNDGFSQSGLQRLQDEQGDAGRRRSM